MSYETVHIADSRPRGCEIQLTSARRVSLRPRLSRPAERWVPRAEVRRASWTGVTFDGVRARLQSVSDALEAKGIALLDAGELSCVESLDTSPELDRDIARALAALGRAKAERAVRREAVFVSHGRCLMLRRIGVGPLFALVALGLDGHMGAARDAIDRAFSNDASRSSQEGVDR